MAVHVISVMLNAKCCDTTTTTIPTTTTTTPCRSCFDFSKTNRCGTWICHSPNDKCERPLGTICHFKCHIGDTIGRMEIVCKADWGDHVWARLDDMMIMLSKEEIENYEDECKLSHNSKPM